MEPGMKSFNTFQRNNLITGTQLAIEIPASSSELRAFVVIGAYLHGPFSLSPAKPSKYLNTEQEHLRFWIRKYETKKQDLETGKDLHDSDLSHSIYLKDIERIDQLEQELGKYIQDFALMKVAWEVDNPLP